MNCYEINTDQIELRSIENPTTPLSDPDDWLWDALGAEKSASGVRINSENAMKVAAYFRGLNLISCDCAKIPLHLYLHADGGKTEDVSHESYDLVNSTPNHYQTQFTFLKLQVWRAIHEGAAYAYIQRDNAGRPLQLLPLEPRLTRPAFRENQLVFITELKSGEPGQIDAEDMLYFLGATLDGVTGIPLRHFAKEELALNAGTTRYSNKFFANNAKPIVAYECPPTYTPKQRLEFQGELKKLRGLDNAHRELVLPSGITLKELSINAKDAMLTELKDQTIVSIANFLNLTPSKLGLAIGTSHNSLEHERQDHLDTGLDPHLCQIEQEYTRKLIPKADRKRRVRSIKFKRTAFLRMDAAARAALHNSGIQNAWKCPDDARDAEGLNPMPNGAGKTFFQPLNVESMANLVRGGNAANLLALLDRISKGAIPGPAAAAIIAAMFPRLKPAEIQSITESITPEQVAIDQLLNETSSRFAKRILESKRKGKPTDADARAAIDALRPIAVLCRLKEPESLGRALAEACESNQDVESVVRCVSQFAKAKGETADV